MQVIKLHGSLNWWHCRSCDITFHGSGEKEVVVFWDKEASRACPDCAKETAPAFVPPISQKFLDEEPFARILAALWIEALEALEDCRRIVFAGYSFPPTDVQLKMLVLDGLARNDDFTIEIVTYAKGEDEKRAKQKHYEGVFAKYSDRLSYSFDGFEEWCKVTSAGEPS